MQKKYKAFWAKKPQGHLKTNLKYPTHFTEIFATIADKRLDKPNR